MKPEEKVAELFLTKRFCEKPAYEPLGNDLPPDFTIDSCAFEVRRLNQQFLQSDGSLEGLEEISFPLEKAIHYEFAKIPFSAELGSFFYILSFKRPLQSKPSRIAREIAQQANDFYLAHKRKYTIRANEVTVEVIPAGNSYGKAFVRGLISDLDSGGWVGEIYGTAIQLALREKIHKTGHIAQNFEHWILILVDTIMPETDWINDSGPLTMDLHHFSGVVVLNPNSSVSLEWPSNCLENVTIDKRH